jgi:hypothetical protein
MSDGEIEPARGDRGKASFADFRGQLVPRSARVRIRLANSDPWQAELAELAAVEGLETAIGRRSREAEAADASIEVRVFTGSRVSGPIGTIPRGFESVIDEAFGRLDDLGRRPRIPVRILRSRGRWRAELLIGQTRP